MKQLNTCLTAALAKLSAEQVKAIKGSREKAMAAPVAAALQNFCKQDAEFAQAVAQGGSLAECMTAVVKGVGNYISDLDAYKTDPRHLALAGLCKEIRTDRVAVDFEI